MQRVEVNHPGLPRGTLMVCIPEVDRRQNHISQVDPNHALLPISLDCLKDIDEERPSAQQICERVAALKGQAQYSESAKAEERDVEEIISAKDREIEQVTQEKNDAETVKDRGSKQLREEASAQIQRLEDTLGDKDDTIAVKEGEIQQMREQTNTLTQFKTLKMIRWQL